MRSFVLMVVAFAAGLGPVAYAQHDAQYEADLNKRADGVLKALALEDADKAARVKQAVIAQYRGIRKIDDKFLAGVAKEDKVAMTRAREDATAAKKPLHDAFLATLSKDLEPAQLETVKDQMTYNVVKVTYDAYCDKLPQLTDTQKAYMVAQLQEAREIAMDQGSSNEKHAVFGRAKGRINNFLAKEGYALKQAEQEWRQRIKARQNAATPSAK